MSFGVIFDWDGVVIDSRKQHEQSWVRLANEENLPWGDDFFVRSFGRRNQDIIPHLFHWTNDPAEIARLGDRKESLYREILREGGIQPLPGVTDLLAALQEARLPLAVGSSTPRSNLDAALELLQLPAAFDVTVGGEDVTRGKPDPEVFLRCAEFLQVPPRQCVVIEDAHYGIEAALAGGMQAVAVATTHPRESFTNPTPHRLYDDMTQVTHSELQALFPNA